MFYGREDILIDLDALWGKNVASLVTCRGRRRIGKSTLIKRFAELSEARFIKIEGVRPDGDKDNADELASFAVISLVFRLMSSRCRRTTSSWLRRS